MLEKIGLPAKPSLRGNNWVVDATNCQGCSSQFTFINRKHHCRRCGGLFCNSCTQWRMLLRGQGDSPVRICEPCKKLEEAARFELRHGHKNRTGRGSAKMTSKNEDDVLNQILGNDGKESFSGLSSSIDMVSSIQRAASSGSSSSTQEVATHDGEPNHFQTEMGSASPEELRQRALDEKKKYKILKGEGKSEEALRAFKRGKELERQADALEISIRKTRKRVLPSVNMDEIQNKEDDAKESGRKNKLRPQKGEEKDDFASELREMGLSVMDLHGEDKKSASMSLEGELFSLLGDISQKTNKNTGTHGIDKTEVVALKKKALALKREGKLAEAKEELKKAKVLEKQLEEQELLAGADDSDDELSALIGSMDDDKQDFQFSQYDQERNLDFDHFVGIADDIAVDSNFEVTDEDMEDPEVAAALTSLGWTDDSNHPEIFVPQSAPVDRETLLSEILSLKREALNQKRVGHVAEAMAQLKKAKLLERDLESFDSQSNVQKGSQTADKSTKSAFDDGNVNAMKGMASKVAPKSRLTIQKELLALKKKALALRREGRLDESEEELNKGKVLEQQLEEMDNASKMKATQVTVGSKDPDLSFEDPGVSRNLLVDEGEEDVTDQDLHDPTYLSLLKNLGWNNEDNELENSSMKAANKNDDHSVEITKSSVTQAASDFPARASRRSKAEIQRELLGLKRKALALRRQGNTDEAEEVLTTAKALEAEMAEMEAPKIDESSRQKDKIVGPPLSSAVKKEDEEDVTETDMHDPALLSMLKSLGSKNEEVESVTLQEKPSKQVAGNSVHSSDLSFIQSSSGISLMKPRSKGEIQRELLGLKRKALALRRKGETEEAEELLQMAKVLEAQMEELEAPKKEVPLDASKDKKSASLESFIINHEKHGDLEDAAGVNQGSHVETVGPNHKVAESWTSSGRVESDTACLPRKNSDNSLVNSQLIKDNHPLLGELGFSGEMGLPGNLGTAQGTGFTPSPAQPGNMMDLLTGEDWSSSQIPAENLENKGSLGSDVFSLSRPLVQLGSLTSPHEVLGSNDDVTTEKKVEKVHADNKAHIIEAISTQSFDSQNDQNSLRQEVLARKRRAVMLKREGKLAEAREELQQAKLLEKSLEEDNPQSKTGPSGASISTSTVPSIGQKEHGASNVASKPLSGRDRFKLQQESLSHKRQALKLRREGRVEEAEAEFELAKALEAQLEELGTHDSKSSLNGAEAVDAVVVEDLLDPQLLSALKAIGLDDASNSSRGPERTEAVNLNAGKSEKINQERVQLEERIKAEKLQAVNLKRSGKQAEALDALRRAKQYEKKLNSLASN